MSVRIRDLTPVGSLQGERLWKRGLSPLASFLANLGLLRCSFWFLLWQPLETRSCVST